MAFILGQLKLEEFGLRPECEYASRKQQALAAYAEQRGPGAILDSEVFAEPMSEAKAAIASVEEKSDAGRTLSLKRDARPPLLFVFKQIVDSAIKAQRDGWQPSIVDEVIRFLKNPDTFMPMMAIDSMRATHIASICSQVVERDPRAQADGQLFYMLLSQNRTQLKHYVKELGL